MKIYAGKRMLKVANGDVVNLQIYARWIRER